MKPNWPVLAFLAIVVALFALSVWGYSVTHWDILVVPILALGAFLLLWLIGWSNAIASGRY